MGSSSMLAWMTLTSESGVQGMKRQLLALAQVGIRLKASILRVLTDTNAGKNNRGGSKVYALPHLYV